MTTRVSKRFFIFLDSYILSSRGVSKNFYDALSTLVSVKIIETLND